MLKYKDFYRKYGTRLIKDFLAPKVWAAESISYPIKSMLFWYNGTRTTEFPTREIGYFKNLNAPRVYNILEYNVVGEPIGNPQYKRVLEMSVIKEANLKEPTFRYVKVGKKKTVPVTSEVLFNLGQVSRGYRYISHPLENYWVWENALGTAANLATFGVTGTNRHKYIFMQLPSNIPDLITIRRHLGEATRLVLSAFPDSSYLNVRELFNFIDPEHNEFSVLASMFTTKEMPNVDIVLTINNKLTIINLGMLASITTAYSVTSKLQKLKGNQPSKLLYIMLNKILEAAPGLLNQPEQRYEESHGVIDVDVTEEEHSEVVLDKVIDEEIDQGESIDDPSNDITKLVDDTVTNMGASAVLEDTTGADEDINTATELSDNTDNLVKLESLVASKVITPVVAKGVRETLTAQKTMKSPYEDGSLLRDMLTYNEDDLVVSKEESGIEGTSSVVDPGANNDIIRALSTKYRKSGMKKDVLSTIYAMQKTGMIIKNHDITPKKSALGETEEHHITIQTLTGDRSTIRVILPVVGDDNTMRLSGNNYVMRTQRADQPLKKISNSIVSINSYYGKLFISRATYKKDDLGYWFNKQITKMSDNDKDLKDIASIVALSPDARLPKDAGTVARYTKGFTYKGIVFNFEYESRHRLLSEVNLPNIEKDGVLVGAKGKTPVVMGYDNILRLMGNSIEELGTIYEYLNIDMRKSPIEYCNAKVYKKQIPVAIILSYYMGFTKLLGLLKTKYTVIESGKRVVLEPNQYRIIFKDKTYIVDRDYGNGDLVLGGLASMAKLTSTVTSTAMDKKSLFSSVFTAMSLPMLYVNEIKLMENMYIDPITKQVLELYKYPTTFKGVILKATEMLMDDNYIHPNAIDGVILKGYERISGMLYLELVRSIRQANNRSHFGKSKVVINPYAVINKINDDSTVVIVDDLNPIAALKQTEDVTYLGSHGRKKETMSKSTRIMHKSEIGIISEGVKDSGEVGISSYLSAAPKIETTRGTVGKLNKEDGWANILSTSAMLAPFATTDAPTRLNFIQIQNAHTIPMANMEAPYVRTGYEAVVAARSSDKFVISATGPGVVVSVSKDSVVVRYDEGGKKAYKLSEWTSKEEAGTTYTHKVVANLKKGDKFSKDDTIAYDKLFFEPDIFDRNRVIYRSGTSLTVALMEAPETYEDSGAISSSAAKLMRTTVTKVVSITVNNHDGVVSVKDIGDKVEPKTPLLSIVDKAVDAIGDLDDRALEILKGLKMLSPKAKIRGRVSNIRVYYNCAYEDLSPTLREMVDISDAKLIKSSGVTGQVDSGYSIQGIPLLEDRVEIKYYIDTPVPMGTGDKGILGNQLKFTVGEVFDNTVHTESGDPVDCVFSSNSIEARTVNSPGLLGTTSKVLEVLKDKLVSDYFS